MIVGIIRWVRFKWWLLKVLFVELIEIELFIIIEDWVFGFGIFSLLGVYFDNGEVYFWIVFCCDGKLIVFGSEIY